MLSENSKNKLEQLVREYQFEHAMDYLKESVRDGIRWSKKERDLYHDACNSRIGGDPDLPEHEEWPLDSNGTPMTFLAQLRLAELKGIDNSSLLPLSGMLYFFVGVDEPAYHIEHNVLYLPEDKLKEAKRRRSPEETSQEEVFTGYKVIARSSIEPPNYGYVDYEQVENEEHEYEQYEELGFELTEQRSSDLAVMFGYPATQHGDCEYEAALRLLTGKPYNYSTKDALDQITKHLNGDSEKAAQEVQDTLLLLALDSD